MSVFLLVNLEPRELIAYCLIAALLLAGAVSSIRLGRKAEKRRARLRGCASVKKQETSGKR